MSTDDERPELPAVPRTRAELRAAREAAEAAAAERIDRAVTPPGHAARTVDQPEAVTDAAAAQDAAGQEAELREAVVRAAGDREVAEQEAAARKLAAFEAVAQVPPAAPGIPVEPQPPSTPVSTPPSVSASPRRFLFTFGAVLGVLVIVGVGLGIVSLLQGPRISNVQVDTAQAIESSGSRVILTANQALADIDPKQVTVEPSTPFTVDTSGRGVGVRFTVPLDGSTEYTIRVADVTGAGGGPSSTLTTTFETPPATLFLLRRDVEGKDKIFLTDLKGDAVAVYQHDKINDFRATSSQLVVAVEEEDGSRLLVMDRDGKNHRELELPGDGYVGAIQVSDRGGLVGYSYSDRELSDDEGRASVLVTQSLDGKDEPEVIKVAGDEASVFVWQFVPDSAAVLFIDFDGALSLVDRSSDAGVQSLGLAVTIQGIARGTYTAIVERLDGAVVELNLADGSERPLPASDPDYGTATSITPFPGGTLRHVVARDEAGLPIGQAVIRVDDDGKATPLVEVGAADSILQACASPSGQYAAVAVSPDLANNPYDGMLLPLPENVETHLIDMDSGKEIVALTGFDASWCQSAPRF